MSRAERERRAYDADSLWERSHRAHVRFLNVFECPNTKRGDRLFDETLRRVAPNRRVLEVGCGDGSRSELAHLFGAAYVLGLDVSERSLTMAQAHAKPGRVEFACHDVAEPILGRFDVIFGSAVLHHVDYQTVLPRLYRENLEAGGLMIFREPLGANVLVRLWWRLGTAAHSPDERPFLPTDIRWLRDRFPGFQLHGVNYLSLPVAIVSSLLGWAPDNRVLRWCDRADHWLDRHVAWLVPRFRYGIIEFRKP